MFKTEPLSAMDNERLPVASVVRLFYLIAGVVHPFNDPPITAKTPL
jgi:hypothetical protein